MAGWIGVDLDGTLAHYEGWKGPDDIGAPVLIMLERVREWVAQGREVKIFTARASVPELIPGIQAWLTQHGLPPLEVTNVKDFGMVELWDDRAVQVVCNTGVTVAEDSHYRMREEVCPSCQQQIDRNDEYLANRAKLN